MMKLFWWMNGQTSNYTDELTHYVSGYRALRQNRPIKSKAQPGT